MRTSAILYATFGTVWLIFCALMARDFFVLDNPAARPITEQHQYGLNRPGIFRLMISMMIAEIVALFLILRPQSYNLSWGRVLTGLLLSIPLAIFGLLSTFHAGGVIFLHAYWCLSLVLMLVGLSIFTLARLFWLRCSSAN